MLSSSETKLDISLPPIFTDCYEVVATRKYQDLMNFIFSDNVCPCIHYKDLIKPKAIIGSSEEEFKSFIDIGTRDRLFIQIPVFVICYCSCFLHGSTKESLLSASSNFLQNYIKTVYSKLDDSILDIIIPYSIVGTFEQSKYEIIFPFMLFLSKQFTVPIFFTHFLKCIKHLSEDSKLIRPQIELMTRLITSTDISECISEIRQVAQLISSHVPQNSTRSVTRLLNSIDNPQSPKPNFYLSNSSQFSTFSAGSSSRTVSVELLENFLDLIDDSVENPLEILKEINDQMYRLKMFPNKHDVTSLFNFALRTYQTIRTQSCYNIVFNLMTQINNYCEPEKVLNLYLKSVSRSSRLNEFIEQCYQHFLLKNKQKLPKELNYPTSLTAKIQNIQRNDIELAFNCLSCWSSAYDGIIRIWNLLLQESDLDISDHFDALNYAQRCFLIHGLKELTEENKDIKKEKIEEKIKELEKMLPNEPKSSVVSRDAEQCANKMSEVMLSSSPAKDTLGATELKLQAMTPEPKHKMAETTYMFLTPRK